MATFTYPASYGARKSHRPAILRNAFGDGYTQRIGDGINNDAETWDLSFGARSGDDADEIEDFLAARAGAEAFDWVTPFGRAGKFVCRRWTRNVTGNDRAEIRAQFQQVFEGAVGDGGTMFADEFDGPLS